LVLYIIEYSAETVTEKVARQMGFPHFTSFLEVVEEVMKKERKLDPHEGILSVCFGWPNTNAEYCRFIVRMQRGTSGDIQMKWKEKVFSMK
jgi:hypothetical protein